MNTEKLVKQYRIKWTSTTGKVGYGTTTFGRTQAMQIVDALNSTKEWHGLVFHEIEEVPDPNHVKEEAAK